MTVGLVVDAQEVGLHRALLDAHLASDLAARLTGHHQLEDARLSRRQAEQQAQHLALGGCCAAGVGDEYRGVGVRRDAVARFERHDVDDERRTVGSAGGNTHATPSDRPGARGGRPHSTLELAWRKLLDQLQPAVARADRVGAIQHALGRGVGVDNLHVAAHQHCSGAGSIQCRLESGRPRDRPFEDAADGGSATQMRRQQPQFIDRLAGHRCHRLVLREGDVGEGGAVAGQPDADLIDDALRPRPVARQRILSPGGGIGLLGLEHRLFER